MINVLICCNAEQKEILINKEIENKVIVKWVNNISTANVNTVDAIFHLLPLSNTSLPEMRATIPVFMNEMATTCESLPGNYVRINAWPGFLEKNILEVASGISIRKKGEDVLNALDWQFTWTPDEPGMISGRIISMIINEAFYALQEHVSTRMEIDTAMKLGTNYPYGPFEWSEKIGIKEIYRVLNELAKKDKRYTIAEALYNEALII